MTIVRRSSPFGELLSLRQAMDRLFEDSFVRPGRWAAQGTDSYLPLDVRATPDALIVEASLPGVKPDDVDVTVEDGTLTITANTAAETESRDGDYLISEIRRGSATRSLSLPAGLEADRASAQFENGVLTLQIPKAEKAKPRQIRINPTTNGQAANGQLGTGPDTAQSTSTTPSTSSARS
jgi:HSP20 family protein